MQFHLWRTLQARLGAARFIAPVEVPEEFFGKWFSRLQKKIRVPRNYVYYSESRLAAFAQAVHAQLTSDPAQPVVFFGPLPFVKCRPAGPYYIYTDGAFFIHYWEYNRDHTHQRADIDRIAAAEAAFMKRAARIWCSSKKIADRITQEYGLAEGKAVFAGTGPGSVPAPKDKAQYENFLVMIAADFERKGGRLAVEAVAEARKQGADLAIKFVGAQPPPDVTALPFVEWCGWLDLQKEPDRQRFSDLMSRTAAQILLSRTDLTPLAIAEAALYGKATLATAVGGIPEMIQDGKSGWVLDPQSSATKIGGLLATLSRQPGAFETAGRQANQYSRENWSWDAVGNRCLASMNGKH